MKQPGWQWVLALVLRAWASLRRVQGPDTEADGLPGRQEPEDESGVPAHWQARVRAANAVWMGTNAGQQRTAGPGIAAPPADGPTISGVPGTEPQPVADPIWPAPPLTASREATPGPIPRRSSQNLFGVEADNPATAHRPAPDQNGRLPLRFSVGPSRPRQEAAPTPLPPDPGSKAARPAGHLARACPGPVPTPPVESAATTPLLPPRAPTFRRPPVSAVQAVSTRPAASEAPFPSPSAPTDFRPPALNWPGPHAWPEAPALDWSPEQRKTGSPAQPLFGPAERAAASEPRWSAGTGPGSATEPAWPTDVSDPQISAWPDFPEPGDHEQDRLLDLALGLNRRADHWRALSREQRGEPWNG